MSDHDHHGDGPHRHSGDGAADWDASYADSEQRWSGRPNPQLVAELADHAPGTALDVGSGEGGDAVWLAQHGWTVTGLDLSSVAIERARRAAAGAGVAVEWLVGSIADGPLPGRTFDLVAGHYLALRRDTAARAIDVMLDAVAPGGTLLVVGHGEEHRERALSHGFDPDDYLQPADFAAALGDGWAIEVDETRERSDAADASSHHVADVVLRARRA
ncbi:class I SAM-dependent methyltransferase [Agromyces sp. SYSU T00194]|uniref:class I SAM-dependent methyltransferase n=1 Tax=Agromyces chitinivorans TaxID=3158560 RepID=UPI0033966BD6